MDKRIIAAVAALAVAVGAGDVIAAGKGNGGGGMRGGYAGTRTATSTTRPADSQRHDGTFLTTGTTANGSTTRPTNGSGKGLRDGSGISTTTTTVQ